MSDSEPTFNVQLSFGPMLVGVFCSLILYGIMISQVHFYYQTYKRDALWTRSFVLYLFIAETTSAIMDMYMMYEALIAGFGSKHSVTDFPPLFFMEPILIVLVSTPIQFFFAWRIQKITKSWWIPGIVMVLSLASLAGGFITGIKIVILKLFAKKPELHWSALLWFLTSCVADVLITVTLVRSLSQRKTGWAATDSVIDKLIRLTVQTGMITAICAVGDVIFFMALPHTALNFLWDLSLARLYTNCLLSTLNTRASLQNLSAKNPSSIAQRNVLDGATTRESRRQTERFGDARSHISHIHSPGVYDLDHSKASFPPPSPGVYELEGAKSSFGSQSPYATTNDDLEFGITVTKVVETVQDPVPRAQLFTTQ